MGSVFQFQKFYLQQSESAMPLTTDAVLLGVWAEVGESGTALDIGTGTGILSLMIAQRYPGVMVHAIDINEEAVKLAESNFENSPWKDRLSVRKGCFKELEEKWDRIVCNPPFFRGSPSRKSGTHTARQIGPLSHTSLLNRAPVLLNPGASVSLIVECENDRKSPPLNQFPELRCRRICRVHPQPGTPAHRLLLEYQKSGQGDSGIEETSLTIRNEAGQYTEEFKKITRGFYLQA
ncbi:MAG: methyltransferase domain-containing protein [Saprospirales bacterium]|nr:MAG: methyltransferase domain-containing protein [Saprospirales bacterium]